jgi:hypothetical protein
MMRNMTTSSNRTIQLSMQRTIRHLSILAILIVAHPFLSGQEPTQGAQISSSSDHTSQVDQASLPQAPKPQIARPAPKYDPTNGYFYDIGVFCGTGASTSTVATKPTLGCGAGMTFMPLPIFVEFGVMGPQANRSYLSGYISVDGTIPLYRGKSFYVPAAIVGYSRLFETGHALDYGLALYTPRLSKHKDSTEHLRIELRDYYTFANPNQHNIMLRVGWMSELSD